MSTPSTFKQGQEGDRKLKVPNGVGKNHQASGESDDSIAAVWARLIKIIHAPIISSLVAVARVSAIHPKKVISLIIVLSIGIMGIGVLTNFNIDVNEDTLWAPRGSRSVSNYNWIEDQSGFPLASNVFGLTVHADGDNVLGWEGISRVFHAIDTVRNIPGYDELCQAGSVQLDDGSKTCSIISATTFWNDTVVNFEAMNKSDEQTILVLSQNSYPDGSPVDRDAIMGSAETDENGILAKTTIFTSQINLPRREKIDEQTADFEEIAIEAMKELRDEWLKEIGNKYKLEFLAARSFEDEFERAIINDIPLVPGVFITMSIFTSLVFFKRDKVQSRSSLGFGAVCCVLLAIMSGYGLLFICGTPFTSMTQILPFIMFGVGLDAAFILSGFFLRTNPNKDIVDRIEETVRDVGISITLTTFTSAAAFAFGCISSIPAVIWLCLYAFPTILVSYLYQFTFFVAIMAIDETRVLENRRDCCCCITVQQEADVEENTAHGIEADSEEGLGLGQGKAIQKDDDSEQTISMSDRFMMWYADKLLLNSGVKVFVIIVFMGLLGGCAYSASLLEQSFEYTDVIPDDSYITPFIEGLNDYTTRGGAVVDVYFRDVDQSSTEIQQQMEDYVNALVDLKQIDGQPAFFWLRDFHSFVAANDQISNLSFYEQFDIFFQDPIYNTLYADEIVLDEDTGNIVASRTTVHMNNVEGSIVTELIGALNDQRSVTSQQSINKGTSDWPFFTYTEEYLIWEFYSAAVNELTLTTILGVVCVTVLSTIFMPHWTAILFVAPLICILYIDLMGILQLANIGINPVSYISLVMSIGLLVDFIVHVLLRYYEVKGTRYERTKEMLRTMGSSVMLGGISTFLGVLPLAFSTSTIFFTVFVTFMGLVSLGIIHGLILLPVLLSMFGPES